MKSIATLPLVCCLISSSLVSPGANANIHGVETISIVAAEKPPAYDLDQVEEQIVDGIKRAKRNYWLRGALIGGSATSSSGNECRSQGPGLEGLQAMCEVAIAVGEAARETANRAEANQRVKALNRGSLDSNPDLAPELSSSIDSLLSSNLLQIRLAAEVKKVAGRQTNIGVVDNDTAEVPGHRLKIGLLKVEAANNLVDPKVAIRLYGEAVLERGGDEAVVDAYSHVVQTPKYLVESWSEGGHTFLATSVDQAIKEMAEVLAEEVLLVVTSPRQRGKGYLIKPLNPKPGGTFRSDGFVNPGGSFLPLDTLEPTFEWQDFREAYTRDPLYADVPASELDVSYDLRIYRARPSETGKGLLIANELLQEYRNISGEGFTPDIKFAPCTPYMWTVRSRFVANNNTHLTYWSGAYKEKKLEQIRKSKISNKAEVRLSRAVGSLWGMDVGEAWREEAQFFPLLPSSPGQKCSREEVRAALVRPSP